MVVMRVGLVLGAQPLICFMKRSNCSMHMLAPCCPQHAPCESSRTSRRSPGFSAAHADPAVHLLPAATAAAAAVQVLEPSWFHGADVLDVGCNEGLLTLALAVHCGCRSVCGVDIDPVLVAKACTNLSRSRSQLNQQLHQAVRDRSEMEQPRGGGTWMEGKPVAPQQQQQQHGMGGQLSGSCQECVEGLFADGQTCLR
jgi:SAM-dependent methyltransferase